MTDFLLATRRRVAEATAVTPDLNHLFEELNQAHFDGFLVAPDLAWNSRLRSSAGRFFAGATRGLWSRAPRIEIASYLLEEQNAHELVKDTLGHEMIHFWLWLRRQPFGHTEEFYAKMTQMGVSRYNTVPRVRPYKHLYRCPSCRKEFPARKKLGVLACASCCKEHNRGKFDRRFVLEKIAVLVPEETQGGCSL